MTKLEIKNILKLHKEWLESNGKIGERAFFFKVDLSEADLREADLREAELSYADLRYANLSYADLRYANLSEANLSYANLSEANLSGANLTGAYLDYSSLPLWRGSLKMKIDDKIAIQILYHLLSSVSHSPNITDKVKEALLTDTLVDIANIFHRVAEYGKIRKNG